MKFISKVILTILCYTILGISSIYASSIDPAINRVSLPQGQRMYGSVTFQNSEDIDLEISITPYLFNPKTDEISEDTKYIFLKVDTDTIKVKAKSSFEVKYEIVPLANLAEGTYFNIISLTPNITGENVSINNSIAQLVILDIVNPQDNVKGVVTNRYTTNIEVVNKGIPFITPLKLKYTIRNDSNYVLTPNGRIDIFNDKNTYKPIYIYLNEGKENIYPGETLEKEVEVNGWYISDLVLKRVAMGEVYNGIDNVPQYVEIEINSFIFELSIFFVALLLLLLLSKSLREDINNKKKS